MKVNESIYVTLNESDIKGLVAACLNQQGYTGLSFIWQFEEQPMGPDGLQTVFTGVECRCERRPMPKPYNEDR